MQIFIKNLRVKKLENCSGNKLFKDFSCLYTKEQLWNLFILYKLKICNFAKIGAERQFHFPKVIARTALICFMNSFLRKSESSTDQMILQYSRYGCINVWYSKSSELVFKFFLIQYRIHVFLLTLVQTVLMWSFQFNLSLIITPKNFVWSTCSILALSILIHKPVFLISLCLARNRM